MRWAALAAALLAGCGTVGPDYERPDLALPAAFPASATDAASTAAEVSASWWTLYRSAELDRLVAQALARNSDIAQAVARVEQADAALRQTGAAVLPEVNADASAGRQRLSSLAVPPQGLTGNAIRLGLSASYEIDFWGRVRRLNEAARAGLLASRYARDTVRLTIASLTTQAWFALHSLDDQIRLTEGTLRTREEGTRLLRLRLDHGSGSALDVEQSEGLRAASAVLLRDLQRQRALAGSQLALLAGQFDLALAEGSLRDLPLPPTAPPGLPRPCWNAGRT